MKKLLSAVLVICMLCGLLAVFPSAKGVAITLVELTGFAEHGNSEYPGFTLVIPEKAHYKLDTSEGTNGIVWRDLTAGEDLSPTDKFVETHEYRAIIYLVANSDYYFYKSSLDSHVPATVNGNECNSYYPYNSEKYLNVVYYPKVVGAEKLTGSVGLMGEPKASRSVYFGREGEVASVYVSDLKIQWQRRSNNSDPFTDIEGATGLAYKPTGEDVGKYLRVKVGAQGYYNYLYSDSQKVIKAENDDEPRAASFTVNGDQLYLVGCAIGQQYLVTMNKREETEDGTYGLTEGDWWLSYHVNYSADTRLNVTLAAELNKNIYVYTRYMETDEKNAGTKVAFSEYYFKEHYYLSDITLTCVTPEEDLQVGGVAEIHVEPIPENATGFEGIRGVDWLIDNTHNTSYAEFFEDYACTMTLNDDKYYKVVYVKLKEVRNDIGIIAQKYIGYNDLLYKRISLNVKDTNGLYKIKGVKCEDLLIYKGVYMEYYPIYPYPYPANMSYVTISDNNGEGAPKVTFYDVEETEDGITVDATEAEAGTYYYGFSKDSVSIGSFRIVVIEYEGDPAETDFHDGDENFVDGKEDPPEDKKDVLKGDINGDGFIDNKDVVLLFRYVSGTEKAENEDVYDYNGDGAVDNKDVVSLFRYVSANPPKG